MFISFQEKNNANDIAAIEKITSSSFVSKECFRSKKNGHNFKIGEKAELFGLQDYPQFNGEIVTLTSIRADGPHGKAYYFTTNNKGLSEQLNWTYEYRLRKITGE